MRDSLLAAIHDGSFAVGERLPAEPELCAQFGVSRATLREAVRSLVESGYLTRVQGSGTFVAFRPRSRHSLNQNLSYSKLISQAGYEPGRRVLSLERGPLDSYQSDALGAAVGDMGVFIERVRSADGRPVIYSLDAIPERFVGDQPDSSFAGSLYEMFEERGYLVGHAECTLEPVSADGAAEGALGVERGSPLLFISQVDYATTGEAVMYSREWHVPGIFELAVYRRSN